MADEGIFGFGILKGRRNGNPRTDEERMQRHKNKTGESVLPQRGSGKGIFGMGILDMPKRNNQNSNNKRY